MRYYIFAQKNEVDFDKLDDYLIKRDKYNNFAMFEINDDNFKGFISESGLHKFFDNGYEDLWINGEDGGMYALSVNNITKLKDKAYKSNNKIWRKLCAASRSAEKKKQRKAKILNSSNKLISSESFTISHFKRFYYINKNEVIPFRFKEAKGINKPLVIYIGGAGTMGCDNFKPLFEFFSTANGVSVNTKSLNILIPQRFEILGNDLERMDIFVDNLALLVRELINKYNIDENRIYIYGISNGAMCTWKSLLNHPDLYAAAVEAMGTIFGYKNANLESIKHIPIWLAHSGDDMGVKIDSDDYCYDKLKSLGADVKYTRWDKYGHKMAGRFYYKEKWLEWLLSKSRQR